MGDLGVGRWSKKEVYEDKVRVVREVIQQALTDYREAERIYQHVKPLLQEAHNAINEKYDLAESLSRRVRDAAPLGPVDEIEEETLDQVVALVFELVSAIREFIEELGDEVELAYAKAMGVS